MPKLNKLKAVSLCAIAATTGVALAGATPGMAYDHHKEAAAASQPTIVEAAMGTGMHETLVAAVKAAGLVEPLSSEGPFTIFAPTDAAFAKLPDGTVATLVKPENKATLTNILTYHAVAGEVTSADLVALIERNGGSATIDTIAGGKLTARLAGDTIAITDAAGRTSTVTKADVDVSNGVIHVTDGVFLPG